MHISIAPNEDPIPLPCARDGPGGGRPRRRPAGRDALRPDAGVGAGVERQHRRARRRQQQHPAAAQRRHAALARVHDEDPADLGGARPARARLRVEDARLDRRAGGQGRAEGEPVPAGRRRPAAHDRALVAVRERPAADGAARDRGRHRHRPDALQRSQRAARGLRRQVLEDLQRAAGCDAGQLAVVRLHDPPGRRRQRRRHHRSSRTPRVSSSRIA